MATPNVCVQVLSTSHNWQVSRGDSLTAESEFYEIVDRDDLAAAAHRRKRLEQAATISGVGTTVAATGILFSGLSQYFVLDFDSRDSDAEADHSAVVVLVGGAVTLAGLGLLSAGRSLRKKREMDVQAATEMAGAHNARLDQQEAGPVVRDIRP